MKKKKERKKRRREEYARGIEYENEAKERNSRNEGNDVGRFLPEVHRSA